MYMTPAHMRAFHAVATTGSFTAAARFLNVSQPPVTKHVRELETNYGVELFHRHSRGAELTETGRQLLQIVQRAVINQSEAVEFLRSAGGLKTGHLRIGAVNPYQAAAALASFTKRYPDIRISVDSGNSRSLVDDLRAYRCDIAVIGQASAMDDLDAVVLSRPEIVIVVSRDHPWSRRRSARIEELARQVMVMREPGSQTRQILEDAARAAGIPLTVRAVFAGREGLLAAVRHGIGIGAASDDQLIDGHSLHKVRLVDANMRTVVFIVSLKERRDARMVRAFMDCVQELTPDRRRQVRR